MCISALDELIPQYAQNKSELDSYKKICDIENEQIKSIMFEMGETEYSTNGYKAKRVETERVTMDEDKLLAVLHRYNIDEVIKTREYVDMDALENYLYHKDESEIVGLLSAIDSCREVKTVVSLRVTTERIK